MAEDKKYLVKNRSASVVVYKIPERGIRREFYPGETKKISKDELVDLSYQSGGKELMAQYLIIEDENLTNELEIHTEQEYWMNENQIKDLLKNGSLDAFLDALDFAPRGVIDLIKKFAVSLPLSDMNKINALKEKTGFDLQKALLHIREEKETQSSAPQRRVSAAPTRRVESKNKVVK